MVWWGWGSAEQHEPLSSVATAMLTRVLGIDGIVSRPTSPPTPAPPQLSAAAIKALADILGAEYVVTDDGVRVAHCRGKSTEDLLRIRAGDVTDAPDAVLYPGSHDDVLGVLRACVDHRITVVPFGGGTSVVGGLAPETAEPTAVVTLDMRRLNALVATDKVSMTATLQPGLQGPEAEALLAGHGLTLGHFPQSFEYATLGGFAATRSSGQASAGYGRFDGLVVAITLATPVGTWRLGRGPENAAGPDLRQLVLGSEGAFGVITELTVTVRDAPAVRQYEGWQVPDFGSGIELLRQLAQHHRLPTIVRLSDETETASGLANANAVGQQTTAGCYLLLGYEGATRDVTARQAAVTEVLEAAGASRLGPELGVGWLRGRFHGPYLRDALLDVGGFTETFETVTTWSNLAVLYAAARRAATAALTALGNGTSANPKPVLVLTHISHLYRTGASLYFTVVCSMPENPVVAWHHVKRTITDAVVEAGGSITHHHGVGTVHRPWMQKEIGGVGLRVLTAVKNAVDPTGILNPGVLVTDSLSGRPNHQRRDPSPDG